MSIEEFSDLFVDVITIEPFQGTAGYGQAQYGTSVSYTARIVGKTKMVRDSQGTERVSTHTVYVLSTNHFTPNDRITLPFGFTPQQPPIIGVGIFPDEEGTHHVVLFLA